MSPGAGPPDPPKRSVVITGRRWLTEQTFELALTRPEGFGFEPGQRIRLSAETLERDYSLVNGTGDADLALCIRRVPGGALSPVLADADIGTPLTVRGPYGYFTYRASGRAAVFVATGTGIAPFVSMARAGVTGFTLIHGVRNLPDRYYKGLLSTAAERYIACIPGASPTDGGTTFQGRVTDWLQRCLPPGGYDFYLCGRGDMVRDVTLLADRRFPGSRIYAEPFF